MFQNLKTDIIYFNTPTDFELEFNLCGCCRMRLFNDKCTDKKSLLLSLSRAVSRSRVIIITAPIFSDDNVTSTVATAIGAGVEVIDNAAHNINSSSEIEVIKGALPLVTPDGIYGGCIIESGPQSLILLTDNKSVRKSIMKNLIHSYIEEIAISGGAVASPAEEPHEEPVEESAEELTEATEPETALITDEGQVSSDEPSSDEAPCADESKPETELIIEDSAEQVEYEPADATEPAAVQTDLFTDISSESDEPNEKPYQQADGLFTEITPPDKKEPASENEDYYCDDDYYTEESKQPTSPFNIWLLVISIIILIGLGVLCFCIFYVPTKAGISPSVYLRDIFDTMFG